MNQLALTNPFTGISVPIHGGTGFNVNSGTLGGLLFVLLPYLFSFAGILLLVYISWGGLQLMLSRGDPKAIQGAQSKITNAIIGFVLLVLAFAIVKLIGNIFNIQVFNSLFI